MIFNIFECCDKSYITYNEIDNFLIDIYNSYNIATDYHFPDEGFTNKHNQNWFSFFCLNISSLPKHYMELQHLLYNELKINFDIITLCKNKLTDDIVNLYSLDNYYMFTNSNSRKSGGLVLYVNNLLNTNGNSFNFKRLF